MLVQRPHRALVVLYPRVSSGEAVALARVNLSLIPCHACDFRLRLTRYPRHTIYQEWEQEKITLGHLVTIHGESRQAVSRNYLHQL